MAEMVTVAVVVAQNPSIVGRAKVQIHGSQGVSDHFSMLRMDLFLEQSTLALSFQAVYLTGNPNLGLTLAGHDASLAQVGPLTSPLKNIGPLLLPGGLCFWDETGSDSGSDS